MNSVVQLADGRVSSSISYEKTIKKKGPSNGTCVKMLTGHSALVFCVIQLADGAVCS